MEYVIKTAVGYKACSESAAADCTHLIFERQEYLQILREKEAIITRLKKDAIATIASTKENFMLEREKREQEHKTHIQELRTVIGSLQGNIEVLKNQLSTAESMCADAQNLNTNLLRIMRERASQKRGLVPKKQHCGYVVLFSEQYMEKYKFCNDYECWRKSNKFADKADFKETEQRCAQVWRTTVQTPFDAKMPLSCLQNMLEIELHSKAIAQVIGYEKVTRNHLSGNYNDLETLCNEAENVLYKWLFRSNRKSGFWDIILFTTKELQVVFSDSEKEA